MNDLKNYGFVTSEIHRCGLITTENFPRVLELKIRSIICMKTNIFEVHTERELCEENHIIFQHIPMHLERMNSWEEERFERIYQAMMGLPKPLIIHCTQGSDRTGIACGIWRIKQQGWKFSKVSEEMDKYGFNPIFIYWKQHFLKEMTV